MPPVGSKSLYMLASISNAIEAGAIYKRPDNKQTLSSINEIVECLKVLGSVEIHYSFT
jgi:hypothetical protein